jgi:hypothetical protein
VKPCATSQANLRHTETRLPIAGCKTVYVSYMNCIFIIIDEERMFSKTTDVGILRSKWDIEFCEQKRRQCN